MSAKIILLLLGVAGVLTGLLVAAGATALARHSGTSWSVAILTGGKAFGSALALTVAVLALLVGLLT
ncbi:hypothetical protein ACIHDR_43055 [Nocardia sp. NPDC052278]|uniref:hypothetical protein n=1 Tax=unclassified Nocardia TaxID=2637762 RepID=UPI0036B4CFA1